MLTRVKGRLFGVMVALSTMILSSCSSDDFVRIKTTDGYLSGTKVKLPARTSEDIGRIVFIRDKAQNKNIPTVFINDRVVGSLPTERYSETLVCPGEQTIRVDTRGAIVEEGEGRRFTVTPGSTHYIQVYEADAEDFAMRELTEEQVQQIGKGLEQSHIINRHQPVCNAPLKVLKSINLEADALFKFDRTIMLPSGQQKVQKLVQDINSMGAKVEQIRIVGHTDRLGSDGYNDKLSLGRAKAVATYMQQQGLTIPMTTAGRGEREPVTTNCKGTKATSQLINCLQPDRRVSIDLIGVVEQVEETGVSSK